MQQTWAHQELLRRMQAGEVKVKFIVVKWREGIGEWVTTPLLDSYSGDKVRWSVYDLCR